VTTTKTKQTVRSLCSDVPLEFVEAFLTRLDEDYFETFSAEEISSHIRMSRRVDKDRRALLNVTPLPNNEFEITLVGYDYPSGFSILCGLLSSFGLDIRTGEIHSFSKQSPSGQPGRIVDVLKVGPNPAEAFDETRQTEFERELLALTDLLATGSLSEARERLNRTLIERVEKMGERLVGLTSPVDLSFDNSSSPDWTLLEAQTEDTFAFLYAISNALAMRGIYIHKVRIRSVGDRATDQFSIVNRWNRKIEDAREQQRLSMTVLLIKEFTRFLPEAPDPARALSHFDQFLDKLIEISEDKYPDSSIAFLASNEGMNMLAQLLGSSDFLWDDLLRIHFAELLPSLEEFGKTKLEPGPAFKARLQKELRNDLEQNVAAPVDQKKILNNFKDRHVFLIDAAHVVQQNATLIDFSYALTDLGEVVLEEAARLCYENLAKKSVPPVKSEEARRRFAIFGLGKFGGREMGYASDFELLFVHEATRDETFFESFARLVVDFIEARSHGIFHIDLRLRPYGNAGTWSTPFKQFIKYYSPEGEAAPFERQALIKLRWFAGDEALGRRVETHRDLFTYSNVPWDWENAMELRRRQMAELVLAGQTNVKYSAGGIVDIEYAVQYLQLLNGSEHREIRLTSTLDALKELRRLQIIREADYATLHDAYLFLRNLIDGLRIVRGDATDLVLPPETSEEFKSLARRLGYRSGDRIKNAELLASAIRGWMRRVHEYFVLRFSGTEAEFSRQH
jgi:[glutamine synthetase] adenylyltransferase / [glutamine synthetase]-adenylyl-L-tyrosine phosphorylase